MLKKGWGRLEDCDKIAGKPLEEIGMGTDWKHDLAKCFGDIRILETSKSEARDNFDSFCDFIAIPAFENLKDELDSYKVTAKIQRIKGQSVTIQINFIKSSICQFQYTIFLPKNSVQMAIKTRMGGRKNKKALLEEREAPFMGGVVSTAVMDTLQEDLIKDVIAHYQDFVFASITEDE